MAGIVLVVGNNKSDIVSALKMKTWLLDQGMFVRGLVKDRGVNGNVPSEVLEDMLHLKVISSLT